LAEVVGANCERLRTAIGVTQDDLAKYARALGLRWKASSVGDFEAGRSAPKFSTVVAVAIALQLALADASERSGNDSDLPDAIWLADLVTFDGKVFLTDQFSVFGRFLADACRGYPMELNELEVGPTVMGRAMVADAVATLIRQSGLTEQRQAKRMGIQPSDLAALSLMLWQKTFTRERDLRAGPDANAQKRGQITRAMRVELADKLAEMGGRIREFGELAENKAWADGDD